jgi:creatinine amidohydrolase
MIEFAEATRDEVTGHLRERGIGVLAVGAVEQHGPHLPTGTDWFFADALARHLATGLDALLLPSVGYGNSWANEGFGATLSLSPQTLLAVISDLAAGFHRLGGRGLVVVNGDFGNQAVVSLAAQQSLQTTGMPLLQVFYPGLAEVAAQHCVTAPAGGTLLHADELETSLMLALRPELVRTERAVAEYPPIPATFGAELMPLDRIGESGVFGDPRAATAATGKAIFDDLAARSMVLAEAFSERLGPNPITTTSTENHGC